MESVSYARACPTVFGVCARQINHGCACTNVHSCLWNKVHIGSTGTFSKKSFISASWQHTSGICIVSNLRMNLFIHHVNINVSKKGRTLGREREIKR